MTVVPSAKAANFTMNRKLIRDLAAGNWGLKRPRTDTPPHWKIFVKRLLPSAFRVW